MIPNQPINMSSFMNVCIAKEAECAAKDREISELKLQLNRLSFLYEDATAKLTAATATKKHKCGNHNGTTSTILSVAKQQRLDADDVFEDAISEEITTKKNVTNKYNKARYAKCAYICACGGKTSTIKSFAVSHENTSAHLVFLAKQELESVE